MPNSSDDLDFDLGGQVPGMSAEAISLLGQLAKLVGRHNLIWWLSQPNSTMFGMKPIWLFQAGTLEPIRKIVKQLSEPV